MFYATVIALLLKSSMANQCNNITKTCTAKFINRNDLQPAGCSETTMWTTVSQSKLSCATSCASNRSCAGYSYSTHLETCSICHGDLIMSLNFTSSNAFAWPFQNVEKNWPLTDIITKYTDRSMAVPIEISSGRVVHLHGYFYSLSGFYIDFREDFNGNNRTFHFRARRDFDTGTLILALSYCINTVWPTETRATMTPYPFVENTSTTVDILVNKDAYQVYIDKHYCCSFNHVVPYNKTKFLRIIGNIEVYEFSV